MFGSNKIKQENETVKVLNKQVMVKNTNSWLMKWKDQCICKKLFKKNYLYCSNKASNIENVEIFHGLHDKVALLMRRRSERGTRNRHQNIFGKVQTMHIYQCIENVNWKMNFLWVWWNWDETPFLQIFLNILLKFFIFISMG